MTEFRQILAKATGIRLEHGCNSLSSIRHDLLSGIARCFNDPGDEITHWLVEGAPAGVVRDFMLDRTFEKAADSSRPKELGELYSDFDLAANYCNSGFDVDEEAKDTIGSYRDKGYLEEFPDAIRAESRLGARPVLSRFGVITRLKDNKLKKRVILDAKASGVTSVTRSSYRVRLPRASDVVNSVLRSAQTADAHSLS
eukprot:5106220-Amphidinium_carterae.3